MENQNLLSNLNDQMYSLLEYINKELSMIHAGKNSKNLFDNIIVEVYNNNFLKLKEIASITTPKLSLVRIEPWDKTLIKNIKNSIIKKDIGINPIIEENIILCYIPQLSLERRRELVKVCSKIMEEGKIKMRNIRRDFINKVKKLKKEKVFSEDIESKLIKNIEELIKKNIPKIENLFINKEKEIINVK